MTTSLTVLAALVAAPAPAPACELPTDLWQVAPDMGLQSCTRPVRSEGKTRAVMLIHGLHVHPLRPTKVVFPERRPWQEPKSELVKALAADSDVFAFSYAQTVPVDEVAQAPGLCAAVELIRKAGYKEIVLIGHSAGGVIARQFVERYPDAGITKVITVAAPFAGAEAATFKIGYPKVQAPFVRSLAPVARQNATKANSQPLGANVQFACVVCKLKRVESDGLVFLQSQWPEDLQQAGVPAVLAHVSHFTAMSNAAAVATLARLTREDLTRWSPGDVERARKEIFGEPMKK